MMTSGSLQSEVEAVEGALLLRTAGLQRADRMAEARRVRDELQEDLDAAQDSVRWLRSELRTLERLQPKPRAHSVIYLVCGLGALVGAGVAMWAR